jgi:hypothetical protein
MPADARRTERDRPHEWRPVRGVERLLVARQQTLCQRNDLFVRGRIAEHGLRIAAGAVVDFGTR